MVPSIAQLVERRTVEFIVVILRSLVRIRLEGKFLLIDKLFFSFLFFFFFFLTSVNNFFIFSFEIFYFIFLLAKITIIFTPTRDKRTLAATPS